MTKFKDKSKHLCASGTLNPSADKVKDTLFSSHDFFDPHDLVQVKYEMVRRVTHEGVSITKAVEQFGFSRPSFYAAKQALEESGLSGLIPKKTGPQQGHKLNDEVMEYVWQQLQKDNTLNTKALLKRVQSKFGIKVHQRTLERAIARKKKLQNISQVNR
jgi:transposase